MVKWCTDYTLVVIEIKKLHFASRKEKSPLNHRVSFEVHISNSFNQFNALFIAFSDIFNKTLRTTKKDTFNLNQNYWIKQ